MNKIKVSLISLVLFVMFLGLNSNAAVQTKNQTPAKTQSTISATTPTYIQANALDIVANPAKYLNKRVKIKATFDKFSTLGLDYKPAFRSSEKYISFLIKRDDVINHTVPLSEMKIFIKRTEAEKYIDLNVGDTIEFEGLVFSNALSDPWIEVEKFMVISTKPKESKPIKK